MSQGVCVVGGWDWLPSLYDLLDWLQPMIRPTSKEVEGIPVDDT